MGKGLDYVASASCPQEPNEALPGWTLVPTEPTAEMRAAAYPVIRRDEPARALNTWRAMLAAAPQADTLPLSDHNEDTMFLASDGLAIRTGDVIRAPITINTELHGSWGDYQIRKAPGGYLLSYLRSEKGQILPEGYTGGYMHDCLPNGCEIDLKTLVFTRVPIRISGWVRVSETPLGSGRTLADATPKNPPSCGEDA